MAKPIRALASDALTGEPLLAHTPKYVIRHPAILTAPRDRQPGWDMLAAPLDLHTRMTEGPLGGHAYTRMWEKFLEGRLTRTRDAARDAERAALLEWWHEPFGVNRVLRGLERLMPLDRATHALEIVLALHREQADPAVIAARYGHTEGWVVRRAALCLRLALAHRVGCTCGQCARRRHQQQQRRQS